MLRVRCKNAVVSSRSVLDSLLADARTSRNTRETFAADRSYQFRVKLGRLRLLELSSPFIFGFCFISFRFVSYRFVLRLIIRIIIVTFLSFSLSFVASSPIFFFLLTFFSLFIVFILFIYFFSFVLPRFISLLFGKNFQHRYRAKGGNNGDRSTVIEREK